MHPFRSKYSARIGLTGGLIVALIGISGIATPPAGAQPSGSPITIALVTSLTGVAGSEFAATPAGFDARIDLQNAEGGVNGHKLVPMVVDDQTTNTAAATQDALAKGAFGLVSVDPLFFLAAKYPQEQGVPVTGSYLDGPEWGEQPYTNMFSSDDGSVDPVYPVNTLISSFLRAHGGTVLGSYGYGITPTSARAASEVADAFQREGGTVGVLDTSVPFGTVDFTSTALTAKEKGVNAINAGLDNNSEFALATALNQAGVKLKAVVFPNGYESDVIGSPAWQAIQGDYFITEFRPYSLPDAGTREMQAAMEKYAHFTSSDFPSFPEYEGWLGADLMIRGLEAAGKNPTRAGVIKALRNIKSYNGNGILAQTFDYSTDFGHDPASLCSWFLRAEPSRFVPTSSQPWCGKDIAGTSTASS
ncbi:MAG TPA: ABC transporter substrate-binding protein [Acidimicrobiales bacterium]|nr:ABC transporter substrate-binding protein [Acidimicrobiales bacterium]